MDPLSANAFRSTTSPLKKSSSSLFDRHSYVPVDSNMNSISLRRNRPPVSSSYPILVKLLIILIILLVFFVIVFAIVFANLINNNAQRNPTTYICDCSRLNNNATELAVKFDSNTSMLPTSSSLLLSRSDFQNDQHTVSVVDDEELDELDYYEDSSHELEIALNLTQTSTVAPIAISSSTTTTTSQPLTTFDALPNETKHQLHFIAKLAQTTWTTYRKHSWGADALRPLTLEGQNFLDINKGNGDFLVASLSTLKVLGLEAELKESLSWTVKNLNLNRIDRDVNFIFVLVDYLTGLLSSYALTGDAALLEKAQEVASLLGAAYDTNSGLPSDTFNPNRRTTPPNSTVYLTDITESQFAFAHLHSLTNRSEYQHRLESTRKLLNTAPKWYGLYKAELFTQNGSWLAEALPIGPNRPLYSHFIKRYIQSNRTDKEALEHFKKAFKSLERHQVFIIDPASNMVFARCTDDEYHYTDYMIVEGCSLGATFGLAARELELELAANGEIDQNAKRHELYRIYRLWELAEQITETCYQKSARTKTGLPPKKFFFEPPSEKIDPGEFQYTFSPQLAESYFTLWRLTHNPKYRTYAWHLASNLYRHTFNQTTQSFAALTNVNQLPPGQIDFQPRELFSGTLKFLYLTFTEDDILPLDQWIFTESGHPLPIR